MFSAIPRGDAVGYRRRIDYRQFLNVVIWRYPIMLRQQMAEFHGEMPSTQSKISLALPRSHCPHCQQTIRVRDNIPLLSADAQRALPRLSGENQQALSAGGVIDGTRFLLASLVWPESGWGLAVMILSAADCREHH